MKIGVFDSGIGGLTVLKEIMQEHPKCEYVYYGDTLHLPYGEKSKEELLHLVTKIIDFFVNKKVDLIVIACGTISSTIYKELIEMYDIKIVNVIDATIEKIKEDNINNVAVLATKTTIDTHIFSKNLSNMNVEEISCPKFVPYIENNVGDIDEIIDKYLYNIKKAKINNIVLGCTHYPLLIDKIKDYLGYPINFYNMGFIISKKIKLKGNNFKLEMYFSFIDDNLINNINKIINSEKNIQKLVL